MFLAFPSRRSVSFVLAGLLLATAGGVGMRPAIAAPQFNFRMATAANPGQPMYDAAKAWIDEIESKSNGRIHIDLFGNSQLGDEPSAAQATMTGTLDMDASTVPPWTSIDPHIGALVMPFIFKSIPQAQAASRSATTATILRGMDSKGVKVFAVGDDGWLVLSSRKPLRTVADFKGLRVRVLPGSINTSTMKAFGAIPQQVAYAEIYLALKQGTIDATEASLTGMYTSKMYEVAKYLAVTNHLWLPDIFVMNAEKYNALPPDLQKIVATAATNAAQASFAQEAKLTEDYAKKLAAAGMDVERYSNLAPFVAAAKPVYDEFTPGIGAGVIDALRK